MPTYSTEIRNKNHVVALGRQGELLGEAKRQEPGSQWVVTKTHFNLQSSLQVATVSPSLSEVLQRRLVLQILEMI